MTSTNQSQSFFWQWRNATPEGKDNICSTLNVSRKHLSIIANGAPPKQVLKMALARHLNTEESILFPDDCPSKRKPNLPSHMVNQHTIGKQL